MSDSFESQRLTERYITPLFDRSLLLVAGKGCTVWDTEGRSYLDLVGGIAVCSTGHCHPAVVAAIQNQASRLIHCSNNFFIPGQGQLGERLASITGLSHVFLTNSGTEATEAALKLARVRTGKKQFIAFEDGFHGRTSGSLACTYKPQIREPFGPFATDCTFLPYGDAEELNKAISDTTAAVLIEPVQGEAGVLLPPPGFLAEVREICTDTGALMMADEIQTGMGRTGTWLACEHEGVTPDIITLAKGIGSGFPVGAMVAGKDLAFAPGEHGGTYNGGPLACAAALASIDVIESLMPFVREKEALFAKGLSEFHPRTRGLMIGITVGDRCPEVRDRCQKEGVLVNCTGHGIIRMLPPLVITKEEISFATSVISEAIHEIR
ncbi:MAG: acetylornithine/succinylornithine family transaminase [Methanospirillaceae archaeon]|nr:acetylornithine/succinylornithine family transaminase [Methanospirillaceae archaeon]